MKWIILLSVVLFAASCSNKTAELGVATSSLNVDIKAAKMVSGGGTTKAGYKRGEAPVYISGITLSATNIEYGSDFNKSQTFNFKSDNANDGDDIVMTDIYVGTTNIAAVGICNNTAGDVYYPNLVGVGIDDINAAAAKYEENLREDQPIYADYASEQTENIVVSNDSKNSITINMDSENHRVAYILENPADSKYDIKWRVLEGESVMQTWSDFINADEQEAFVINSTAAKGSKSYTVEVKYFTKTSRNPMVDGDGNPIVISKTIEVTKLDNVTKLYRFSKGTLLTGSVSTTITWETKDPTIGGETIE